MGTENVIQAKLQGWKMQEWKMEEQTARVENATGAHLNRVVVRISFFN